MNLSALIVIFLAWKMLDTQNKPPKQSTPNIESFLSEDTKILLDCLKKLQNGSTDEKMAAILQLLGNPTVMNLAQSIFKSNHAQKKAEQASAKNFGDVSCKDFFRPIDNIADDNVKNKLYSFYDNWYIK